MRFHQPGRLVSGAAADVCPSWGGETGGSAVAFSGLRGTYGSGSSSTIGAPNCTRLRPGSPSPPAGTTRRSAVDFDVSSARRTAEGGSSGILRRVTISVPGTRPPATGPEGGSAGFGSGGGKGEDSGGATRGRELPAVSRPEPPGGGSGRSRGGRGRRWRIGNGGISGGGKGLRGSRDRLLQRIGRLLGPGGAGWCRRRGGITWPTVGPHSLHAPAVNIALRDAVPFVPACVDHLSTNTAGLRWVRTSGRSATSSRCRGYSIPSGRTPRRRSPPLAKSVARAALRDHLRHVGNARITRPERGAAGRRSSQFGDEMQRNGRR